MSPRDRAKPVPTGEAQLSKQEFLKIWGQWTPGPWGEKKNLFLNVRSKIHRITKEIIYIGLIKIFLKTSLCHSNLCGSINHHIFSAESTYLSLNIILLGWRNCGDTFLSNLRIYCVILMHLLISHTHVHELLIGSGGSCAIDKPSAVASAGRSLRALTRFLLTAARLLQDLLPSDVTSLVKSKVW